MNLTKEQTEELEALKAEVVSIDPNGTATVGVYKPYKVGVHGYGEEGTALQLHQYLLGIHVGLKIAYDLLQKEEL